MKFQDLVFKRDEETFRLMVAHYDIDENLNAVITKKNDLFDVDIMYNKQVKIGETKRRLDELEVVIYILELELNVALAKREAELASQGLMAVTETQE